MLDSGGRCVGPVMYVSGLRAKAILTAVVVAVARREVTSRLGRGVGSVAVAVAVTRSRLLRSVRLNGSLRRRQIGADSVLGGRRVTSIPALRGWAGERKHLAQIARTGLGVHRHAADETAANDAPRVIKRPPQLITTGAGRVAFGKRAVTGDFPLCRRIRRSIDPRLPGGVAGFDGGGQAVAQVVMIVVVL